MGNQLFSNYTIEKKYYLESNFWKIYHGEHKETKEKVSIFVFDKNELSKYSDEQGEKILSFLRKEADTLKKAKNQHKNFLNIIQPLSEDLNKLAFITEPILFNIKTWVNNINNLIQKKLIINQIINVTNFMHNTYHISHNNLNINNIFITENNIVKISCFCSTTSLEKENEKVNKNLCELTRNIKYFAPEMINENKIYSSSDIFSIGSIFYYILNDNHNELIDIEDNKFSSYKKFFNNENYKELINNINDEESSNFVSKFLNISFNERIKIEQSLNLKFFKDKNNKLQTLCVLNDLEEKELKSNYEFLKELPNKLNLFSIDEIKNYILPNLFYSLKNEKLINPIIPSIFTISDLNDINFKEEIWPFLKLIFKMKSLPTASLFIILKRMNFILDNISLDDFINEYMPIIFKALDCGMGKIQEVIIEQIKIIYDILEYNFFIDKIYFRLIQILYNTHDEGLIKKIFFHLKELPKLLSFEFINNKLLNDIEKILKKNKSYIICKEISSLYIKIINDIDITNIKNKIIPNLFFIISEGEISEKLYNKCVELINELLEKIKNKRRKDFIEDDEMDKDENKIKKLKNDLNIENTFNTIMKSPNTKSKSTCFSGKFIDQSSLSTNSNNDSDELNKQNELLSIMIKNDENENENIRKTNSIKINNKTKLKSQNELFESLINDDDNNKFEQIIIKKNKKNIPKIDNNKNFEEKNKIKNKKSGWDNDEDDDYNEIIKSELNNNINNENISKNEIKSKETVNKIEKEDSKKSSLKKPLFFFKDKNKEITFKEKKMEERAKKIDLESLLED